jgi:mannose/fructose/N-acetylgalactosamine-specific phosphotransferase system component IID
MIWALFGSFWRSFFLQALWNYERMQNVGFAFSLEPLLKRVYKSRPGLCSALRRHIEFFNVHPYLAPLVMGVVYHKEKALAESKKSEDPTLTVLKDTMGGAFGALGDHVIWGTWRPFCAVMALGVGALVAYPATDGNLQHSLFHEPAAVICAKWWVVGFLAMFNSIHVWLRWMGLQKATTDGPMVVRWVESLHLQIWATQIRRFGLLFLAAMVMAYLARWTSSQMLLWMVAVLLGSMILKRWGLSGFLIFYLVCGVSVAMTFLGIHWP